tara:strand:+ start:950 stop:1294 length:345 start_codon:yes stop_codon:yes gene_type:complete
MHDHEKHEANVNHPKHYTQHPSGIECIQITEHMGFSLGNAIKYIWRADLKNDAIEDLRKAVWYIEREIDKRIGPKREIVFNGPENWPKNEKRMNFIGQNGNNGEHYAESKDSPA